MGKFPYRRFKLLNSAYKKAGVYRGKGRKNVWADLRRTSNVTANRALWAGNPRKYDFKGIDTRIGSKKLGKKGKRVSFVTKSGKRVSFIAH